MTAHCPDCFEPVTARANAREGRCEWCRPQPARRHSDPRSSNWTAFIAQHNAATTR